MEEDLLHIQQAGLSLVQLIIQGRDYEEVQDLIRVQDISNTILRLNLQDPSIPLPCRVALAWPSEAYLVQ